MTEPVSIFIFSPSFSYSHARNEIFAKTELSEAEWLNVLSSRPSLYNIARTFFRFLYSINFIDFQEKKTSLVFLLDEFIMLLYAKHAYVIWTHFEENSKVPFVMKQFVRVIENFSLSNKLWNTEKIKFFSTRAENTCSLIVNFFRFGVAATT